ncbi:MAG: NUDIX domain-containing protein [Pseudomonadota bacterium]
MSRPIRLAVRAIVMQNDHLLLVNAYPGRTDLWCAPGGGAEPHQSLPDNLAREVFEETGLTIDIGDPVLCNEFHDPDRGSHQVELFFRCRLVSGTLDEAWADPEQIVSDRRWVSREEYDTLLVRPKPLAAVAWQEPGAPVYDPLERIIP